MIRFDTRHGRVIIAPERSARRSYVCVMDARAVSGVERGLVSPFRQPRGVWAVAFACVVSFMGIGLVDPILPALSKQLRDLVDVHANFAGQLPYGRCCWRRRTRWLRRLSRRRRRAGRQRGGDGRCRRRGL